MEKVMCHGSERPTSYCLLNRAGELVWSVLWPGVSRLSSFFTSVVAGQLWIRVGASILSSEGRWFESAGLHVEVSFGNILNPKTAPDVQPLPSMYEYMYYLL